MATHHHSVFSRKQYGDHFVRDASIQSIGMHQVGCRMTSLPLREGYIILPCVIHVQCVQAFSCFLILLERTCQSFILYVHDGWWQGWTGHLADQALSPTCLLGRRHNCLGFFLSDRPIKQVDGPIVFFLN